MKGWFTSLLCLLLIGALLRHVDATKEYNRDETFVDNEPRGFFSKLDSDSLSDRSIWNVKNTYLSRRNLMPASPSEEEMDSVSNMAKRSSIFRAKLLNDDDDDDELQLTKRDDVPQDESVGFAAFITSKPTQNDTLQIIDKNDDDNNTANDDNDDSSSDDSTDFDVRRDFITAEDAEEGADFASGSSEEDASLHTALETSGSGENETNNEESGSTIESASTLKPSSSLMPEFKETATLFIRNDSNPSITISDLNKRNIIPFKKRQYITRPKFVVRNGYVYMKAPPLTQKTIVTTHIPRPPMVMPYNRFLHNYRRDREMAYGMGRRTRYMVPDHRYMEPSEDTYDDDRGDESHCDGDPCMNGATCNEVRDGYECICPTGFKGTDCEEEDRCHPNPCRNNGVCTEANGQYVCTCAEGFKGTNCQEINHCQPNPCHNAATCMETGNDFECICSPEYMGKDCSEINRCHMTPCLNGGTCTTNLGMNYAPMVNCVCLAGYSGSRCELRDRCHINPCKNGGLCHDGLCTCVGGYAGELCETPPSPCSLSTCLNGGTCIAKGLTTYKCVCRHGFKGTNCEDESRCEPNPCLNTGVCVDQEDGYKCDCRHGYKGTHCEDEVSPCDASPCLNDGNCINEYSKYKCLCRPGYKGLNCEELDRCHHHPCKNGGTCIATDDDVRCDCLVGYKGLLCAEIDHCTPSPCQNNGVCYENADSYTCQCNGGYKGLHCTDRDPCHLNPCSHQGICIPEGLDYRCECSIGWIGKSCDLQDKCHPNPCLHGGVCLSRDPGQYECHCPSGFAGIDCEVEGFPGEIHHYEDHLPAVSVIPCRNTHYGCCPDGETSATGPSQAGCPEHHLHSEELSVAIPSHDRELELRRAEEFHRNDDYREMPRPHSEETDWARRRSHYWSRNW